MAVTKFQQVIWSKKIQDDLELKCKLVDNCTREYEGDCEHAKSVRILGVGNPTIGQYTGADITIEEMSDKDQLLNIDQANYFAFEVKDVDKAQSVPGLPEKYQKKAVHGLAVKRDSYVAGLAENAENITTFDSGLTTQNAVKEAIDNALVALRERNVDVDNDVVIEISPALYKIFKNELIELKTNNDELIKKGVVGMYDSANVVMTNNLLVKAGYIYVMVRTKTAIAFAGQINEVEAGRMEKRFSDYIRGLDTFGSKIIAQDEIQVLKIKLPTTTENTETNTENTETNTEDTENTGDVTQP